MARSELDKHGEGVSYMSGSMTVGELMTELAKYPVDYKVAVCAGDDETNWETCHKIDDGGFDGNEDARLLYMTVYK